MPAEDTVEIRRKLDIIFTLAHVPVPGDWAESGACRAAATQLFFPTYGDSTADAKAVCRHCEVKMECREFAMRYPMLRGVWGGLSEGERKRLRKRLASLPRWWKAC